MRYPTTPLLAVVLVLSTIPVYAGGGTALTYPGRLLDAGEPANGTFNIDFSLWDDPAVGSQIGSTVTFNSLPIADGLFTVELDFGASAFDNTDRWLEIVVDGVPLLPRQPITRAPYSIQTRGIFVDENQNVGIGTTSPQARFHLDASSVSNQTPFQVVGENEELREQNADLESRLSQLEALVAQLTAQQGVEQ